MWKVTGALVLMGFMSAGMRAQTTISWLTVNPASVSFAAVDPAASPAPVTATIQWRMTRTNPSRVWSMAVQSASSTVANCPRVPLSAFKVTCTSVTNPSNGTGGCSGSGATLTTSPQIIANGTEGNGTNTTTMTVQVAFTDSWRYPGALAPGCSLNLTYTLNAQ